MGERILTMRYFIVLLALLLTGSAFAQTPVPAASFAAQVAAAQVNKQLVSDLYAQLQLAQKQLATVQGAQGQMQQALSDAQAKVASCKAY
jgi:peptidoglycan hydrolase CwlO-like protein